ncbi:diacylglycerol/lipid kinase family protein [Candidatus Latescibacterota bacterium]
MPGGKKIKRIDVIATTISGSISDWQKVKRIVPLFVEQGFEDVRLHEVNSHSSAREAAYAALKDGSRIPISAGGSGTFRAVLEGCIDSGVNLLDVRLGFLRKGSADLIGKVLNMPDDIDSAIKVFAKSITSDSYVSADILNASCISCNENPRHFIGYGGAEIFGRIPFYTENRYNKYYKGIMSQLFGDLGPFTTGMLLSLTEKLLKSPFTRKKHWQIIADGELALEGYYQAIIIVNGYLGPDMPFSDKSLGSGEFYVFGLKDIGVLKLISQAKHARSGTIVKDPLRWGLESVTIKKVLELTPDNDAPFPVNVDGSTFIAKKSMTFKRVAKIPLISNVSISNTEPPNVTLQEFKSSLIDFIP